jgi:hypothetical protein
MATIIQDDFEFYEEPNNHKIFILKGFKLTEELNYIKNKKILSVSLDNSHLQSFTELSFLKEIDFIEEIRMENPLLDYSGIYVLKQLKKMTINVEKGKPNLDYSKFKHLEYLSIDWYAKFPDLSQNMNLKELIIWKFRPNSKSLKELKLPENLESLEITESNIINFEGLNIPNLKKLEGHYCSKLESLLGIENLSHSLTTLILDYCGKLIQYDSLNNCKKLQKIILGDCGDLPTLDWLIDLKNVKHFSFWNTKLKDGNVNPCFGIDYVSFKNSKIYNHKIEEFR